MRICVDAHAIGRNLTGNEVYIRNLLSGYAALDKSSEFIAYVSEEQALTALPDRIRCRTVSGNPFVRLGYGLTKLLRQDRPDLLHVQYTAPLACPVPVVVSVHDVSFLEHPEYFPPARAAQLQITVKRTVRAAARVLTPSEFSARAIRRAYGLGEDKITVVPNGVGSQFRPISRETAQGLVRNKFGVDNPYVLMVGDLQPRKNQAGLIRAFDELLRSNPELPHRLVLTGQDSWYASSVRGFAARSAFRDRIHFTGFVDDADLPLLYGGCDMFVFPSLYEGFGIPILEAMACGRAVACSSTTATAEVADGAGILFDPASPMEMMRAMRDLLLDGELRARMERLGQQRAASFHWRDAARRTLEVYHEVAGMKEAVKAKVVAVER